MGTLLLVQLSDIHLKTSTDPIFQRWSSLCNAVAAELDGEIKACVIVFCGDAAFGGKTDQFNAVEKLLIEMKERLVQAQSNIEVHILTVPGNHDCDLTTESDEEARQTLRSNLGVGKPSQSVTRILLQPQENYFDFASRVGAPAPSLSRDAPFYCHHDIVVEGCRVRFHLINSSWTSVLKEHNDLRFPVSEFTPPQGAEAKFGITLLHHPLHWFYETGIRRELQSLIDRHSEIVLTGHEHEHDAVRKETLDGPRTYAIEGGVLQDPMSSDLCNFNIIRITPIDNMMQVKTLTWKNQHFEPQPTSPESRSISNPQRIDLRYRLRTAFETWLNDLEDPLTHPRNSDLHLSDLFDYPDLRKTITSATNADSGKNSEVIDRIRSADVIAELMKQKQALVFGGDRSGKTSLAKRLFADLHNRNTLPVFIRGKEIHRNCDSQRFRHTIEKAIGEQYQSMTLSCLEQLQGVQRVLIVDDFQDGPQDTIVRRNMLDKAEQMFETVLLLGSDDLYLELINRRGADAAVLLGYQRYEICDFGYQRLEGLALKWIQIGNGNVDPQELRTRALEICQHVQSVLGLAGLPHTPWLLLVVLEQQDQSDAPFIAARNGNIGHLYHAVITVALSRTKIPQFDLSGKFIYLAELARLLHTTRRATITEMEARGFHKMHCDRFVLPFDYEKVRDDLIETRMLRLDGDEVAFRSKWVYCYFMAWWLNRNMRHVEAQDEIKTLTGLLYHEISANILVFLAHLSDDPLVIGSMRDAASKLFATSPRATMTDDVKAINIIGAAGGFFRLPATPPDINRKMLADAQDNAAAMQSRELQDGRQIDPVPRVDEDNIGEAHRELNEVRAALKTIRILGQVLRNGASSIEGPEKLNIMDELLGLGRRVLGRIYADPQTTEALVSALQQKAFRILSELHIAKLSKDERETRSPQLDEQTRSQIEKNSEIVAKGFWFGLTWVATFNMVKRMSEAIGITLLDPTLKSLCEKYNVLPHEFVSFSVRMNRRGKSVPADDLVRLHKRLVRDDNRLARVVLEAMTWERLLLFETDHSQSQKLCQEMGIKVPTTSLDPSRKKFSHGQRHLPGK